MRIILFLLSSVLVISCRQPRLPANIQRSVEESGANRSQIAELISHYSGSASDSLKLRAALFLVDNYRGRGYYTGELLKKYMDYPAFVMRDLDHGEYIMNSFSKLYGPYDKGDLSFQYDLKELKAEQLISNIDAAFKEWGERPWAKSYDFEQFCNYVLPFRIDDEAPCYNRMDIYKKFSFILDSKKQKLDVVAACALVNDELIKEGWVLSNRATFLPHYNADTLIKYRTGSCREMVDLGIYTMRSLGIPVTFDFLPHWPYRRQGHSWDVVINEKGKAIPFLAAEDDPGTPHRPGTVRGKVYRHTFIANPLSLAGVANESETLPELMDDPYTMDVTDEYAKVHTVKLVLNRINNNAKTRLAYLSVFDDEKWQPIAWSKLVGQSAVFDKVEGGIVFMPSYFSRNGVVPANPPFILNKDGSIHDLIADTRHRIRDFYCQRIYPVVAESYMTDNMTEGRLQGANKRDFSDRTDLYEFKVRALPGLNKIIPTSNKTFRYIRFISSAKNKCSVAEFNVYSLGKRLSGEPFGATFAEEEGLGKAVDGNAFTSYESGLTSSWIALDLGKPVKLDSITLLPKIDNPREHGIVPGKAYTLNYWIDGKWKPIGTQVARTDELHFRNVPSNALYLLSTDLRDTRIFTYQNGKQAWW
ncbi:discoidin domain-containing protein [Mucilaginibacter sp. dw_454]|uniref:discoidin domain-containing protein n=1 Tax=Mucilaginibacter sp. dw_454 TaxID=2720079 RepID=UPI001BD61CDE|nr:discoidin domain-containing protein [Mucilaginibacter sp. dw_454]